MADGASKYHRPPGYLASRRALDRLRRLQDLIRHHQRWAHQIELARPLSELLPGGAPENDPHRYQRLEREIDRLLPLVHSYLRYAGIETVIHRREPDTYYDKEKGRIVQDMKVIEEWDLIVQYFEHAHGQGPSASTFNLVIRTLDRGIGVYEARRAAAFRDFFNPVSWLAALVGLPVTVLERAGLANESSTSVVLQTYAWIVRLLIVALLGLALTKLGATIPWEKLFALVAAR